ncbi:hypothetical protein EV356DRAFT_567851 [Viridothelium virens]|uniref:Uncharacterized protein n=1 Tax=Viridothelium virens TaxID=1048519 RepID=A0A6A6H673_VIRVR|nr:hypothetical protein EV356DRAFT_567851 [Viridothelium virens]
MIPLAQLRDEYLTHGEDPLALGFISIFLGGSVIHQQDIKHIMRRGSDWDGVGIVRTKQDIVALIRDRRASLRALLGIIREDSTTTSWEDALVEEADWQVLRFSGWTCTGSKRTMRIWSQEHLEAVASCNETCYLGVLSHKVWHNIRLQHESFGPGILVSPPTAVTDRVSIMTDFNILQIPYGIKQGTVTGVWPGVVCDIILTSWCMFEHFPGLVDFQKRLLWSKWLLVSNLKRPEVLAPFLCHWYTFSQGYKDNLVMDAYRLLEGNELKAWSTMDSSSNSSSNMHEPLVTSPITIVDEYSGTQRGIGPKFVSYHRLEISPAMNPGRLVTWKETGVTHGSESKWQSGQDFVIHRSVPVRSAFSSNSDGEEAMIEHRQIGVRHRVYIKTADTFLDELDAMKQLECFVPKRNLQNIIAVDRGSKRILYEYFDGKSLLDIRTQRRPENCGNRGISEMTYRWLLSIESQRAHDMMLAYRLSYLPNNIYKRLDHEPKLHRYFFHRLHNDTRLKEFYQNGTPTFLDPQGRATGSLKELLALPVYVNNKTSKCLREHLDTAESLLHPQAEHFSRLPFAYGLGDGHGGNVMVADEETTMPVLRFVDYEVAGYNPILLELAKPIYHDCFYNALWGDLLADDLRHPTKAHIPKVRWHVGQGGVYIEYDLHMSFLDKALATTKFEYLVCPILQHIHQQYGPESLLQESETALGHALLCCAMLSRDFSHRADLFFLNLAIGVDLVTDMRGTIDKIFGLQNWPAKGSLNRV